MYPCTLCARRVKNKFKQAQAIKHHLNNSSETSHQLDKCVMRQKLHSTDAKTHWSKETTDEIEIDKIRKIIRNIRLKNTNNLHK